MPKVGDKHFEYTKAGKKAAKAYAKRSGKKLKTAKDRGRGSRGNRV